MILVAKVYNKNIIDYPSKEIIDRLEIRIKNGVIEFCFFDINNKYLLPCYYRINQKDDLGTSNDNLIYLYSDVMFLLN
jgi:hypothetical protein